MRAGPRRIDQAGHIWGPRANSAVALGAALVIGLLMIIVGSARASSLSWSAPTPITESPADALLDISCPSASFCVAIDAASHIYTSTDPAAGGGAWSTATAIDAGHALTKLFCASAALCVAVDDAGDVVTSTNPAGGAGAWSVATVAEHALRGVTCPSTTLCLVVGGDGLFYATNPTGGAGAWTSTTALSGSTGFHTLACATASLCVAGDSFGDVEASTHPLGDGSEWSIVAGGSESSSYEGAACPSTTLCVVAENMGQLLISTTPTTPGSWERIKPAGSASGVSCPTTTFCVAVDDFGQVITSTNPTGGVAAWTATHVESPSSFTALRAVACPSTTLCVAGDAEGNIITGSPAGSEEPPAEEHHETPRREPEPSPTPGGTGSSGGSSPSSPPPSGSTPGISSAQLVALLKGQLTPSGGAVKIGALLKHGGLGLRFTAPEAGTLSIQWYEVPPGAKLAGHSKAKPVLVASGQRSFATAGRGTITVKLTAIGKRLLRPAKRMKLVVKETFGGSGSAQVSVTGGVVVRR